MLTQAKQISLMRIVLKDVRQAVNSGENPFACILVDSQGKIIAKALNSQVSTKDRTAHAEIVLIRKTSQKLNRFYLIGYSIVINSEPCAMCMSLLVKAKIDAVYYGASQDVGNDPPIHVHEIVERSHHKVKLIGGILKAECEALISSKRHVAFEE